MSEEKIEQIAAERLGLPKEEIDYVFEAKRKGAYGGNTPLHVN